MPRPYLSAGHNGRAVRFEMEKLLPCALVVLAGCGGRSDGADPRTVEVPTADDTPPLGTIALILPSGRTAAEASQPGEAPHAAVEVPGPRFRGRMVGSDQESGAVRARVAITEWVTCRGGGTTVFRSRRRYFPPSQVERATAAPGAHISASETRTRRLRLGHGACPAATVPIAVTGELWGDVTNGVGLEAVTPHIRFVWRR